MSFTRTDLFTASGLKADSFNRETAFCRNVGLVSSKEQHQLEQACVAIPGLGGCGGAYAEVLARQGIGNFKLADFDTFGLANFNRQMGATVETVGLPKLNVIKSRIQSINPFAVVSGFPQGINAHNIEIFLKGVDVVIDSVDFFSIDTKRLLIKRANQKNIPVITAAPLGFGAAVQIIMPGRMSFDDYYGIFDGMSESEKLIRFWTGFAPKGLHLPYFDRRYVNIRERYGPSSMIGIALCAGMVGLETLKLILRWGGVRPLPHFAQYDARREIWYQGTLWGGYKNPLQGIKRIITRRQFKKILASKESHPC